MNITTGRESDVPFPFTRSSYQCDVEVIITMTIRYFPSVSTRQNRRQEPFTVVRGRRITSLIRGVSVPITDMSGNKHAETQPETGVMTRPVFRRTFLFHCVSCSSTPQRFCLRNFPTVVNSPHQDPVFVCPSDDDEEGSFSATE